jgi:D-beta-D-heptose 7-phosphate kinase/D-beta-D-heptose 1-phosphate adenosyltransferase
MPINILGEKLKRESQSNILITRGAKGMSLFCLDGSVRHIPTAAREIYDVTGAGDTVIATLALALSLGVNIAEAAVLANHAAGITVAKIGASTLSPEELITSLK